ncbi:GNAT family N-acetyltransferase [Gracilibacillus alcaliphilus]|uniref:GNAT family N-acetyltransferase n=1 Tax=Gracilibacillus alcaliphilus TaxID=1401441 RepID=UPI00195C95E0|nr:GNAT family N-acetyltransferase [Gracilibacillus alcaliphilus]MBM7675146.1 riboflavin biosynthesis RibT protein [Gracilibacillus alcaliphilus]
MLIRFKKRTEKIAMGLLSFMPEEKEVKRLQDTIHEYEVNDNWQLFLWKEADDVLGAIGVCLDQGNGRAIIQHLTVTPSHRSQGIGKKMVQEVKKLYADRYQVVGNDLTGKFFEKCQEEAEE